MRPTPGQSRPKSFILPRLIACTASIIDLLPRQEPRASRRQKDDFDVSERLFCSATVQLVNAVRHLLDDVRQLAKYRHPEVLEVYIMSSSIKLRRNFVPDMNGIIQLISVFSFLSRIFPAIDASWFSISVSRDLREIQNCYLAYFADDFKSIRSLGSIVYGFSYLSLSLIISLSSRLAATRYLSPKY